MSKHSGRDGPWAVSRIVYEAYNGDAAFDLRAERHSRQHSRDLDLKTAETNHSVKLAHSNVTRQARCDVGVYKSRCSGAVRCHGGVSSLSLHICAKARRRMIVQAARASAAAAALTFSTTLTAPHELLLYIEQCIVPDCTMSSGNPFRTSFAPPPSASSVPPASSITLATETRRPEAGIQHDHDGMPLPFCVSACPWQ